LGCSMKQTYSAAIGIIGGLVDLLVGLLLLRPVEMIMASEPTMLASPAAASGYFLSILGIIVLLTGLYLLTSHMMNHSISGALMLLYGLIMLILGAAMLGQLFSMMQGSMISGIVMLVIGAAMLYSGYGMIKK
jgi:hypothetical protein